MRCDTTSLLSNRKELSSHKLKLSDLSISVKKKTGCRANLISNNVQKQVFTHPTIISQVPYRRALGKKRGRVSSTKLEHGSEYARDDVAFCRIFESRIRLTKISS